MNFNGPVKHKPVNDLTRLVLRHMYGSVTSVSTTTNTMVIERDTGTLSTSGGGNTFSAVDTGKALTINVDTTNGTLFYDLDNKTNNGTIKDFSNAAVVAALQKTGEYVRVAARYQQDGTFVATRIFASTNFNKIFISPEGYVIHADQTTGATMVLDNADGKPITVAIDPTTQFFFRTPNTSSDAAPIGTGPSFLTSGSLVRGFKVKITPVDVTASTMHAATVDIETAPYQGKVTNANSTNFSLTSTFPTPTDNYKGVALSYISATTPNGVDPLNPKTTIAGFKYWNYAYPTIVTYTSGSTNAITNFIGTTGAINFGSTGTNPPITYNPILLTYATWAASTSNPGTGGWTVPYAIFMPQTIPNTTVATPLVAASGTNNSYTFATNAKGGSNAVTVNVNATAGSAALVYQVDRTGDVVTVSPIDITTTAGLTALTNGVSKAGTAVQVSGVPKSDGTYNAYLIKYYTAAK
ncbi:hypothetical protein ACO0KY_03120 [Undibacterium sp. Dicai25W]|uniref:hypothetical protein n=1 Tax=Undibacterium sp. Dicai25W TaxID=3413034 RepID=UPI003BF29DDA